GVQQCRLQTREREVEPGDPGDREVACGRVSLPGEPVDRNAAGIAEAEQARALVERLAGSVVERRPEQLRLAMAAHGQQLRVSSAREQADERRLERRVRERERGDVPAQVV